MLSSRSSYVCVFVCVFCFTHFKDNLPFHPCVVSCIYIQQLFLCMCICVCVLLLPTLRITCIYILVLLVVYIYSSSSYVCVFVCVFCFTYFKDNLPFHPCVVSCLLYLSLSMYIYIYIYPFLLNFGKTLV